MSKIETTSKVSLELTSRINPGRWRARPAQSTLLRPPLNNMRQGRPHNEHTHPEHTPPEEAPKSLQDALNKKNISNSTITPQKTPPRQVGRHPHTPSPRKYIPQPQGPPPQSCRCQHILGKNQDFQQKIVHLLKAILWKLCWRYFSSVFSFCNIKSYC